VRGTVFTNPRRDQAHAIVVPHGWYCPRPVGIKNTNCVCFGHYRAYIRFSDPPKPGNFRVFFQAPADRTASKDESYDAPAHVLIDASKRQRFNGQSGFFPDFSQQSIYYGFIALKDTAGRFPMRIISPLDNERPAVLIDYDTGNANRVARVFTDHLVTPIRQLGIL
jgi:hypothetical protein